MSASGLTHWGGLAAMLVGVLWVVRGGIMVTGEQPPVLLEATLPVLAVGLAELHARLGEVRRALGKDRSPAKRCGLSVSAAAVLTILLVSCSGGPTQEAADDLSERCGTRDPGVPVQALSYDPDSGEGVDGFVLGEGARGVVFSNQIDTDLCDWLPFAREMAGKDRRTVIFDYSYTRDASKEVEAAAGELGGLGVEEVVLVGASKGAVGSLAAASSIREPSVSGVASLSAVGEFEGLDSREAAEKVQVPLLVLAARGDAAAARVAPELAKLSPSKDKQVVLFGGYDHGIALLTGENGTRARRLLKSFVDRSLE